MKRLVYLISITVFMVSAAHASRLSQHMHRVDAEQQAAEQREWQEDMNFSDDMFRLSNRYQNDQGQFCRDYVFRSKSNPYRDGHFVVCDSGNSNVHYHR